MERSYKNRPAGFRTHILVCVGANTAAMTGLYLYLNAHIPTDLSRLGAQVVSGLGFIGAGTIIVTKKNTIKGLTTAAGLWTAGIIGLAIGSGFFEGGIIATALVLVTEIGFASFSKYIHVAPEFRLLLTYGEKMALDQVMRHCKDKRLAVMNLQVTSMGTAEKPEYAAELTLRPRGRFDREELISSVKAMPNVWEADEIEVNTLEK
ncbi:MAG: MgtC/SapB family protein [Lachnospiraceae bacterium]|nr:MgtC/SapB family protein [Lachnospiraceae bacterium]